jgi:hypothetical protein
VNVRACFFPEPERRRERAPPVATVGPSCKPFAQDCEPALQPALHGRERHAARRSNLARCLAFEVPLPHDFAVRRVERLHCRQQLPSTLLARD